jgi:hypothetical protein
MLPAEQRLRPDALPRGDIDPRLKYEPELTRLVERGTKIVEEREPATVNAVLVG